MSDDQDFQCARCGSPEGPPLGKPPFKNDLGHRVAREICRGCFEDWKQRQMLLINHYALNLRDREAREFLMRNMEAFLFGEGEAAEIDTSMEGTVGPGGVGSGPQGPEAQDPDGPAADDNEAGGSGPGGPTGPGGPAGPPPG